MIQGEESLFVLEKLLRAGDTPEWFSRVREVCLDLVVQVLEPEDREPPEFGSRLQVELLGLFLACRDDVSFARQVPRFIKALDRSRQPVLFAVSA